jgi:uncharacterized membrane protein YadS
MRTATPINENEKIAAIIVKIARVTQNIPIPLNAAYQFAPDRLAEQHRQMTLKTTKGKINARLLLACGDRINVKCLDCH